MHGPLCRCVGGSALRLSSAELEEHVAAFLADKYRSEAALLDALERRSARGSFVEWLDDLERRGLPPALAAAVRDDVRTVCASIAGVGDSFSCI
jgi:hypothetical protein